MGVSVESGRRRGMMVDLNLVPFIDFMSCLIAFLMIAAVWTQVASLDVNQAVSDGTAAALGPPPLTVHVRADGYFACRDVASGVTIPLAGDAWDEAGLQAYLAQDRATFPGADQIVINTDDGVPYEAMIGVLDQSRAAGFPNAMLAGGAPNPG